jgi:Uma2 family endonuclease/DNA-binding transcriptional regulator YdaS (Cro superfamily)
MMKSALKKAVENAGGQTALAERIGSTQGHISKWLERNYVPPEYVLTIEKATGVSRHELRPDIYPAEFYGFREADTPPITGAPGTLPRRRWTVAEIEATTRLGIISKDERFELIDGDVVPMNAKGIPHETYKGSLLEYWMARKSTAYRIMPETTYRLDKFTFIEPDFLFYDAKFKVKDLKPEITLLAVEVADSSFDYDTGTKTEIYAKFGVKTLWVFDVESKATHVFSNPEGLRYSSISKILSAETLVPDFAPELAVKIAELPLI